MYRLFWKLFFSFWMALLLFSGGAIFAVSSYIEHANARYRDGFETVVAEAQTVVSKNGQTGLQEWTAQRDEERAVPFYVVDNAGIDILKREVPPHVAARLLRILNPKDGQLVDKRFSISTPDGQAWWLLPDVQGTTLSRLVSRPKVAALQLLLATLIGGIVCFALAWYLISPIEKLRRAALLYGSGEFRHRVGPSLGKRKDEIVDLAFAMDTMAEHIDTLIKSQHTLLRDVSHELRSPLARAQAAIGLARQQAGEAAAPEFENIETEMERLNELIGRILSYYRLDSGQRQAGRQVFLLDELIREVIDEIRPITDEKQCRVDFNPVQEAAFLGDETLIYSAVSNILQNTVRYSPVGSTIQAGLDRTENGKWRIEISDSGPGVDPELLCRIFEPFFRADASRAKDTGGFGLGLAIARQAVESHGGTIAARNRKSGGLAVTILLPAPPQQKE